MSKKRDSTLWFRVEMTKSVVVLVEIEDDGELDLDIQAADAAEHEIVGEAGEIMEYKTTAVALADLEREKRHADRVSSL